MVIKQKSFFCPRDAISTQESLVLKQYFLTLNLLRPTVKFRKTFIAFIPKRTYMVGIIINELISSWEQPWLGIMISTDDWLLNMK